MIAAAAAKLWLNVTVAVVVIVGSMLLFCCCNKRELPPREGVSFYYWKTQFVLNDYERDVLRSNGVKKIFTRYFDLDLSPQDSIIKPVSAISFVSPLPDGMALVPVVYIKNRVFEGIDSTQITDMSRKTCTLVAEISRYAHVSPNEIQFDCDWTDKTRKAFFYFLEEYKKIAPATVLSATIRLHQVKYRRRTGVPPVDYGVLMFYNMGQINADSNNNSIYDKETAASYLSRLNDYPLRMSVALPIFSWGIQIRGQKVVSLLNKMYRQNFETDSNFTEIQPDRFVAKKGLFKGGYYFQANDGVKIEQVSRQDLLEMADMVQPHLSAAPATLIFYDLDSLNFIHYDTSIFYQTLRHFY